MVTTWLGLAAILAVGSVQSISSAINGAVGRAMGITRAAWIFLAVGSIWAFSLSFIFEDGISAARLAQIPPYLFIPGVVNILFMVIQIRVVNILGAMLTQGSVFAGQMVASLFLDHIGFAGLRALPASPGRVVGVLALLAGVALLATASAKRAPGDARGHGLVVIVTVVLGSAISTAMALNASLGSLVGPLTSTGMFLMPGAVALTLYFAGRALLAKRSEADGQRQPFLWLFLVPGTLNVVGVTGSILFIPLVGVQLMTGMTFSAGVLTGLLFVDRKGLFGLPVNPVNPRRIVGAVILVVGVIISTLFRTV